MYMCACVRVCACLGVEMHTGSKTARPWWQNQGVTPAIATSEVPHPGGVTGDGGKGEVGGAGGGGEEGGEGKIQGRGGHTGSTSGGNHARILRRSSSQLSTPTGAPPGLPTCYEPTMSGTRAKDPALTNCAMPLWGPVHSGVEGGGVAGQGRTQVSAAPFVFRYVHVCVRLLVSVNPFCYKLRLHGIKRCVHMFVADLCDTHQPLRYIRLPSIVKSTHT